MIRSGIRIFILDDQIAIFEKRGNSDLADPYFSRVLPPTTTPPERRLYYADGSYRPVPTRYVAVSVNSLFGLRMFGDWTAGRDNLRWLWTRRLVERVNDSIFIFDMDRPAERGP